ncbi:MAG: M23 family metallopeptidase [Sphingomonadales bacterium]|nr:M23 family metallopeptidase [Sphingomonadales bacterium]
MTGRRAVLAGLAGMVAMSGARGARARIAAAPITIDPGAAMTQGGWLRGRAQPGVLTLDGRPVPVAADGAFLVAFDRDCGAGAELALAPPGAARFVVPLAIAPRAWRIEQVDAPFHPPAMPDAAFLATRKLELARIEAARALQTGAAGWRQHFRWPAQGRISGRFGAQRVYRGTPGTYHSGTDIAGGAGAPITAPADGVVILAAETAFTLEGHLLMIDHGMGLNSALLHCSALLVHEGEVVRQGQEIARIGMTGRATGPHLHWSLRWGEARLDPELFAGA